MFPGMSPLMLAQAALDRPELVAQMMAQAGKAPPAAGGRGPLPQQALPTAPQTSVNDAQPPAPPQGLGAVQGILPYGRGPMPPQPPAPFQLQTLPSMPEAAPAPVAPPAGGLAGALSPMPAPTPIQPAVASNPAPAGPMPPVPAPNVPTPDTMGTTAAGANPLAAAIAGLANPSNGGGQKLPQAPAPFIQGALNPQTAAILEQLTKGSQGALPLSAFMR